MEWREATCKVIKKKWIEDKLRKETGSTATEGDNIMDS